METWKQAFFFHFCCFYLTGQFMHDLILPVDMVSFPLSCDSLEYQTLGSPFFYPFFPLSSQSFILFSLCRISSVISHLLSFVWFHPPTMGVKITFQLERFMLQSASRCNLFFCRGENIRLHLLHFTYVNQNGDAHLLRPARRCI